MTTTQPTDTAPLGHPPPSADRSRPPAWGKAGAGAGLLVTQGALGYLHPVLGIILAATDIAIPPLATIAVLTAILWGRDETCERVFRLLRWITNRPEPPAPRYARPGNRGGLRPGRAGRHKAVHRRDGRNR